MLRISADLLSIVRQCHQAFEQAYDGGMANEDVTVIQMVEGSDAGGVRRTGLSEAQRAGQACLVCGGSENLTAGVGYVDGVRVKVHSYHVEQWRSGVPTGR